MPGAIPVPEELWGLLPELGGAELKVLLFLFFKTLGFRKREDGVALSEMMAGTGLLRSAVVAAVRRLEERGCLEVVRARAAEEGQGVSMYRLRFRGLGL